MERLAPCLLYTSNVLYVGADEMNSSMNAVQTYQTGLSMGEREYLSLIHIFVVIFREIFKVAKFE